MGTYRGYGWVGGPEDVKIKVLCVRVFLNHKVTHNLYYYDYATQGIAAGYNAFTVLHPQTSTFQGILVTDFTRSFAVFTYRCGDLEYSNGATIGFSSGDGLFANHQATLLGSAQSIACLNEPNSPWVNVVYELTG